MSRIGFVREKRTVVVSDGGAAGKARKDNIHIGKQKRVSRVWLLLLANFDDSVQKTQ